MSNYEHWNMFAKTGDPMMYIRYVKNRRKTAPAPSDSTGAPHNDSKPDEAS